MWWARMKWFYVEDGSLKIRLLSFLDSHHFAEEFSNGYLLGEVLHKYQLQDDFDQFSQNRLVFSLLFDCNYNYPNIAIKCNPNLVTLGFIEGEFKYLKCVDIDIL